jgi:hypothetical protein
MKTSPRFDRSSTAVLLIALGFIACAVLYLVFAFGQPSDGWIYEARLDGQIIAQSPLMPVNSPLQPGDRLQVIDGTPIPAIMSQPLPKPVNWQIGGVARYNVIRDGYQITLDVPLRMRGLSTLLRFYQANGSFPLANFLWYLIGFGIFFLRPRDAAARLLLLFTTYWNTINTFIQVDNNPAVNFYPSGLFVAYLLLNSLWLFMFAMIIHFMLVFPVRKWPVTRSPKFTLAILYSIPTLSTALQLISGQIAIYNAALLGMVILVIITILSTTVHNLLTFKDSVARAQVRWVVLGISTPILTALVAFGLQSIFPSSDYHSFSWVWNIASLLLPICFGIAITRYRLFDIDVIIRRTLVYSLLTVLLGLVYYGLVTLLQASLAGITRQQSPLAIVISTLVIAALFNPLRVRIQNWIDRRFYRSRYNAAEALDRFSQNLRHEVDLPAIERELIDVVSKTIQPEAVSLWTRKAEKR